MNRSEKSNPTSYLSGSTPPNDEVDLGIIFRKIHSGFTSLGRKIRYVGEVIIRRFLLVSLFVFLGLALSYFKYVRTPPEFVSSMTLTTSDIRNDYAERLIFDLNQAVADQNLPLLAKMLHLDEVTVQQIIKVEYKNLDERLFMEDSILVGQPFVVTVSTLDKTSFPSLESGVKHYLENNQYFVSLKAIRKQRYENLIVKLNQELRQIDSLKTKVVVPSGLIDQSPSGIVIGQPADPVNMFRESMELFNQKLTANAGLAMVDNFHIISGMPPRTKPSSPILEQFLSIGLIIGFLVGTFIAILVDKYKNPTLKPVQTQAQVLA